MRLLVERDDVEIHAEHLDLDRSPGGLGGSMWLFWSVWMIDGSISNGPAQSRLRDFKKQRILCEYIHVLLAKYIVR